MAKSFDRSIHCLYLQERIRKGMVTVISRFRVRKGSEGEMRRAFLERSHLIENETGFCGFEVLTDASDPAAFLLLTRWTSQAAFRQWHDGAGDYRSHEMIPRELELDGSFAQLAVGNRIEDLAGVRTIRDALEGQTLSISRWLTESDAVFALVLANDGTILIRNRAADRIFSADPTNESGRTIWDFLVCSDAQHLRQKLSGSTGTEDHFLLNLANAQNDPICAEAKLVNCSGGFLLLGAIEQKHTLHLQEELLAITNQLSVMAREVSRKNKELEEANRTIEQIARTDALTGLPNRGTFDETLEREMAWASRQGHALTLALADVDHFKMVNDKYGHTVGDQVLALLGQVLGAHLRPYDLAARYGGEEFALVLPGASVADGAAIAERLRKEIESMRIAEGPGQITVSVGVAGWTRGEPADDFVARADAALYKAKRAGRNRVEVARSIS